MPNRILIYAAALLGSACTTAMYNGPKRPASEVATLISDKSVISQIDGVETPYSGGNYAEFEVLPGEHSVAVTLSDVEFGGKWYSKEPYTICMKAAAGRSYRVQIVREGIRWHPYIVDDGSKRMVSTPCAATPSK